MADSLASYVPNWVVRRLLADPAPPVAPLVERLDGAVLFADLSGFTALAERLAARGTSGAEDLSCILNAYFSQFIELIAAHGGDIIKFAGDAVLAAWPTEHEDLPMTALRAVQCAQAMQARLHNYPVEAPADALSQSGGEILYLPLRTGIGAGELIGVQVGGVFGRWEFFLAGAPLAQMSAATHMAQPGQVALSLPAWRLVKERCTGSPLLRTAEDSPSPTLAAMRLEAVNQLVTPRPLQRAAPSLAVEQALQSYVPQAMIARLGAGQAGWLAELRRVTVLFVNLPGIDHTLPNALDVAQSTVRALQTILYRYEGSLRQFMVDDKGATLISVLGLPPLAHEDDAIRGVMAAMEMVDALGRFAVKGTIGVASGQVFCGFVGNERRREYAVVGNIVNLASRLMEAAAPGKGGLLPVWCDQATYQAARNRIGFSELPEVTLRGVPAPVQVYRPVELRHGPHRPRSAMIGRTAERIKLANALQSLIVQRASGAVILEGEAGIGKTRLLQDLYRQAEALQVVAFTGVGSSVEVATPYYPWREIFDQILGFISPENRSQRILEWLEGIEPGLSARAALLNPVLLTDDPQTGPMAHLTGQAQVDHLHDLLCRMLCNVVEQSPKVIILEDAHWMDSASWDLAAQVARQVRPLLLVAAARPMGAGWQVRSEPPAGYHQLLAMPHVQHVRLGPLRNDETLELICQRLGVASLTGPLVRQVLDKAEGHPFFAEELAYALRDKGWLKIVGDEGILVSAGEDWSAIDLPHTIQGMITSRIDRLTPAEQLTLKVASVIGRVFDYQILCQAYPVEADRCQLADHLRRLEQLDLVVPLSPEGDVYYLFKTPIICDVAYHLMPYTQRQKLHAAVAAWYEQAHTADLHVFYGLLVHHWSQAGDAPRTLDYLEKSGQRALSGGAALEAARFFEQALQIAGANQPVFRRGCWQRFLGEARYNLGQLGESMVHLRKAVRLLGWPLPAGLPLLLCGVMVQAVHQALHRLSLAVSRRLRSIWRRPFPLEAGQSGSAAALPQDAQFELNGRKSEQCERAVAAVRAYERIAQISYLNGEALTGAYAALRGLNLAEDLGGPPAELARTYAVMIVLTGIFPGLRSLAGVYDHLAWQTVERLDDPSAAAWVAEATASYCLGIGQWARGMAAAKQGIAASERLENWDRWSECTGFLANIHFRQGQFERSRALCMEMYTRAQRHNQFLHQAVARLAEVENLLMLGGTEEALALWEGAADLFKERLGRGARAHPYGVLAVARLRRGERALAIQAAQMSLQRMSEIQHSTVPSAWALASYAGPAEVFLNLWEAQAQGDIALFKSGAQQACKGLHRYRHFYPFARPLALLYQGRYDWLAGKARRAQRAWRKALAFAEQLQMPYEQGLAHYEIGRHATRDEREDHLARAAEIFERLGATYNLAQVRQALG